MTADDTCFCGLPIDGHPTFMGEVLHETGTVVEPDERCQHTLEIPTRCELPAGHSGAHVASGELPEEVAAIVQSAINDADRWKSRARRAYRWYCIGIGAWAILVVVQLTTVITAR